MTDLTVIGSAQADNPCGFISVNEDYKEEPVSHRSQGNDSLLSVISSIIDPGQRRIPIKLSSRSQGDPVLTVIGRVFIRVEDDARALL
nr:hypothetical protein [Cyanobium sp. Copco_Reservoir_LC18]